MNIICNPQAQDANRTSHERSIYVLCLRGSQVIEPEMIVLLATRISSADQILKILQMHKNTLWPLFRDRIKLSQDCRATTRRQFTLSHQVSRSSFYSFDRPRNDGRFIAPWSHPIVLVQVCYARKLYHALENLLVSFDFIFIIVNSDSEIWQVSIDIVFRRVFLNYHDYNFFLWSLVG